MSIYLGNTLIAPNHPNAANQSLSNLNATGEKHFLNKNQITNCITEIPQDIKLELNNGTLTLKAGSKVYVPNGFEQDGTTPKFDVVTTESDTILASSANGTFLCYVKGTSFQVRNIVSSTSGTSQPTSGTWLAFYNTSTNEVSLCGNSLSFESGFSFPFAIITISSGTVTSIKQIFNGFGYIGSTVFVLPGVKGLIPAGRNADGTLKNIEVQITSPKFKTYTNQINRHLLFYNVTGNSIFNIAKYYVSSTEPCPPSTNYVLWYNPVDNLLRYSNNNNRWTINSSLNLGVLVSTDTSTNGYKVTELTQTKTIQLVTEPSITETYINGTSWYRVYSDGWCEQGGQNNTGSAKKVTVNFLKPFGNVNYTPLVAASWNENTSGHNEGITTITSSSMALTTSYTNVNVYWRASGYIN